MQISHPEFIQVRLSSVDCLDDGVEIGASLVCPTNIRMYLVLVFPQNWRGEKSIDPCQKPSFDMSIDLIVRDNEGKIVFNSKVTTNSITYATWHKPSIAMALYTDPPISNSLREGQKYTMKLKVHGDIPDPRPVELWLDYVRE